MANTDKVGQTIEPDETGTVPTRGARETTERVRGAGEERGGARNGSRRGHDEEASGVEDIAIPDYVMRDFGPTEKEDR